MVTEIENNQCGYFCPLSLTNFLSLELLFPSSFKKEGGFGLLKIYREQVLAGG
jgi:hypothetical protein